MSGPPDTYMKGEPSGSGPSDQNPQAETADLPSRVPDEMELPTPDFVLETAHDLRTEYWYTVRKRILDRGVGPMSRRNMQYFTVLKDFYDEKLAMLQVDVENLELEKVDLTVKIDKSKTNNEILKGKLATRDQAIRQLTDELPVPGVNLPPQDKAASSRFTVQVKELPKFSGDKNAEKVITFLTGLERVFVRRARETGTKGNTDGWGDYAVGQLTGEAEQWGQAEWTTGTMVAWDAFKTRLRAQYIPQGLVESLEGKIASLKIGRDQSIREFNDAFLQLRMKLRIIEGRTEEVDNKDQAIIRTYTTKIQMASKEEPSTKTRMKNVWGQWVQWRMTETGKMATSTLPDVMTYFQTVDNALHGEPDEPSVATRTKEATKDYAAPVTTRDPDAMDLSRLEIDKLELFRMGVEFAKRNNHTSSGYSNNSRASSRNSTSSGGYRSESRSGRNGGDNNSRQSNWRRQDRDEDLDDVDAWKRGRRCWNCGLMGHLRVECRKKKKVEARITELEDGYSSEVSIELEVEEESEWEEESKGKKVVKVSKKD